MWLILLSWRTQGEGRFWCGSGPKRGFCVHVRTLCVGVISREISVSVLLVFPLFYLYHIFRCRCPLALITARLYRHGDLDRCDSSINYKVRLLTEGWAHFGSLSHHHWTLWVTLLCPPSVSTFTGRFRTPENTRILGAACFLSCPAVSLLLHGNGIEASFTLMIRQKHWSRTAAIRPLSHRTR